MELRGYKTNIFQDSPEGNGPFAPHSMLSVDSGAPIPDCVFQPAAQRYRLNEQSKL